MNRHKLIIEITQETDAQEQVQMHITGDTHIIARSIYGLVQHNKDLLEIFMEVLLNGLSGSGPQLKESVDLNKN